MHVLQEQVELTLDYGGFPQESIPAMQGGKVIEIPRFADLR